MSEQFAAGLRAHSTLSPLRWLAEETVLYDPGSGTIHSLSCPRVNDADALRRVAAGSALELVWAPTICECGPDLTLALS